MISGQLDRRELKLQPTKEVLKTGLFFLRIKRLVFKVIGILTKKKAAAVSLDLSSFLNKQCCGLSHTSFGLRNDMLFLVLFEAHLERKGSVDLIHTQVSLTYLAI